MCLDVGHIFRSASEAVPEQNNRILSARWTATTSRHMQLTDYPYSGLFGIFQLAQKSMHEIAVVMYSVMCVQGESFRIAALFDFFACESNNIVASLTAATLAGSPPHSRKICTELASQWLVS